LKKSNWTSALETGISAMDLDHQTLLGLVNRVIAASEESRLSELKSALLDLEDEMSAHFEREELLMIECRYESAVEHQEEHQQLAKEIHDQIEDVDAGQGRVSYIARVMRNWLVHHIVTKDAAFGRAVLTQIGTTDRRQYPAEELDIFAERRLGNLEAIRWSPELALGIDVIDVNHRAMIDSLNAILVARHADDASELAALLQQFGVQTATDFQVEEDLMSRLALADADRHKDEHRKLLDEFVNQVDDWREDRISAELLCRFMYRWLLRHIASLDVPLGQAILQKNPMINAELNASRPAA
jgi:hemerythrin-like metal-binding protein